MRYSLYIMSLAVGALAVSCADEFDQTYPVPNKPANIVEFEYLNEYAPLKEYVSNPNFKLGAALDVSAFNEGGIVYQVAKSNFTEVVAGNAMKMASCVNSDNGAMDFGTVKSFVNMATDAGLNVYGHTLVWHAQQPKKWLEETLLADVEIEVEEGATQEVVDNAFDYSTFSSWTYWGQGPDGTTRTIVDGVFQSYNPAVIANFWEFQYHVADGITWKAGQLYKIKMELRASADASFTVAAGTWGGQANTTVEVGTEWKEVEIALTAPSDGGGFVMFQSGNFAGTIEMKSLVVSHEEALATSWFTPIISNGDAEGDDCKNFFSTHVGGSNSECDIVDGAGTDGSRAFVVTSKGAAVNSYDSQFFIKADRQFKEGDKVKMAFDYRADVANGSESQAHGNPGAYIHWDGKAAVNFTTEWQHFEKTIVVDGSMAKNADGVVMQSWAWNLDVGVASAPANKYYFDNIVLEIEESGTAMPQTPEQKRDTLVWAMDQWIAGMMKACGGKVKAWDLINEAVSGADTDGDGDYDLQHAANVNETDRKNNFYWQDYIGDVDFVRYAASSARRHYKANGGEGELLLFINDYNLESTWDDNKKLKSLVNWIKKWECDTVKIDGIGSQMHISYNEDADKQKKQEECVVNMLKIMSESGKLVRISELDMGYVDKNGKNLTTNQLTEDQHRNMAKFYTFIIEKYFEIVPEAQQYGICQWCMTDAAEDSGWRKGEPVGLWDRDYNRKHTYGGFADGLK